jgi:hypothetical protein
MIEDISLFTYLVLTLLVALSCTGILLLMFMLSDYIATRRERKKRKSIWDFPDEK